MKKIMFALLGVAALAGSSCSSAPECTPEMVQQKVTEMGAALQAAITKDPANPTRVAEMQTLVQDATNKFQGAHQAEACKAFDEIIVKLKG